MSKVIVFSGKKQSGKNTCANYIYGEIGLNYGCLSKYRIDELGQLWVVWNGGDKQEVVIDPMIVKNSDNRMNPFVRVYAFADEIKEFCVKTLRLNSEQVYGTDTQKNAPTKFLWKNMPGLKETKFADRSGLMTGRDIMQYVGTEIFRKMYEDIWVDSCYSRIDYENPKLAIITDCRYPNEVMASKAHGAVVVRLTRNPHPNDSHDSETALDKNHFDWDNFDCILDNQHTTIGENCEQMMEVLKQWHLP